MYGTYDILIFFSFWLIFSLIIKMIIFITFILYGQCDNTGGDKILTGTYDAFAAQYPHKQEPSQKPFETIIQTYKN